MLAFLYCLLDVVISHINFISKHDDKYTFTVKFIQLLKIIKSFPLEVAQKCQHCQLYALRENSSDTQAEGYNTCVISKAQVHLHTYCSCLFIKALEVFVNNTNLTFLSFLYKISIEVSQKIKLPPVGLELTTLTITGLQV